MPCAIMALDPNAKVIVVSALGQKNILKDAFKLGAADFIVKPFDKRTLPTPWSRRFSGKQNDDASQIEGNVGLVQG